MGRVILSVVVLVLLTILIVTNLGPTAPINLFGAQFEKVPVVAIAMLSFALGVVYSLFLYIGHNLHRSSRERLAQRHREVEERERKLNESREKASEPDPAPQSAAAPRTPESPPARSESALARFFKSLR
ncbi:MAG TPA: hypothetical protein VL354_19965 [Spirochaetia bacterium]|nr:hypothetical protein [Spirochaetia bacterium]